MSERRAFADRVRRQRERRGVSLESIAHATKVPASLFAGLERGDCSRWPATIYSRAYVRAYAEAIGLDANEAVEDFTAAFGSALPDGADLAPPRRTGTVAALRLSMEDEPALREQRVARRVTFAAVDFFLAFGLAWLAHVWLQPPVWTTVGIALAYHAAGRLLTDDPVLFWFFTRSKASVPEPPSEDVSVSDPARTTA